MQGRVLIIGAGGVATVAAHKVAQNPDVFKEVMIASRTEKKCKALADVLASSVLRGRKAGGFVAFLIFIALSFAMSWLQNVLLPNTMAIIPHLVWDSVIALVCAAGMYFLTAWVMDRKLSV